MKEGGEGEQSNLSKMCNTEHSKYRKMAMPQLLKKKYEVQQPKPKEVLTIHKKNEQQEAKVKEKNEQQEAKVRQRK